MTHSESDTSLEPYFEGLKYFYEESPALDIEINYHGLPYRLELTDKGDWVDLYCEKETVLHAGERAYISQGISMKLPQGYEAIMAPRSSTFKRYGVLQTNSIGKFLIAV